MVKVRWLDAPPLRMYEKIAKAAINCHSDEPEKDFLKIDSPSEVRMFGKHFRDGHAAAKWLTLHMIESGHLAMLEFSGQIAFYVSECSRGLTHEQVRQRVGVSYAQRSTRYVGAGDYIIPTQLDGEDRVLYDVALRTLGNVREGLSKKYPKDVTRHLHPIAVHSPIVVGFANLRSFMYDMKLRCCQRAHWEIRDMAYKMKAELLSEYPALEYHLGPWCKTHGYCPEGDHQCEMYKGIKPTLKELLEAKE